MTTVGTTPRVVALPPEEEEYDVRRLRESAKIASIYHQNYYKDIRSRTLSHVVQASLNFVQFVIMVFIESFHHVHHATIRRLRQKDKSIPSLPEERNPIFFLYPICMILSFSLGILWLVKKVLPEKPQIAVAGCAFGAFSMLVAAIMEMRHTEIYIDITKFTDDQLITHPVFIHNFIMCILSIFVMTIYLIQAWLLYDLWRWVRRFGVPPEIHYTPRYNVGRSSISLSAEVIRRLVPSGKEKPGELDPIPEYDRFPSRSMFDQMDIDNEPVIFYCCFYDWFNYIKKTKREKPIHEFQVIHVL